MVKVMINIYPVRKLEEKNAIIMKVYDQRGAIFCI